jgi:hypothetical protein
VSSSFTEVTCNLSKSNLTNRVRCQTNIRFFIHFWEIHLREIIRVENVYFESQYICHDFQLKKIVTSENDEA